MSTETDEILDHFFHANYLPIADDKCKWWVKQRGIATKAIRSLNIIHRQFSDKALHTNHVLH